MSEAIFEALCAVLDQLNVAVIILSITGKVRFSNRPASVMLEAGWPIRILDGCLQGRDREVSARLKKAIELLSSPTHDAQAVDQEICFAQASEERPGAIGCVRLVPTLAGQEPAVALFIVESGRASQYALDGLAEAYGLSKAETRILKALVEARTPAEAAALLNIALSTVKSHLRKIFLKTNTSRQSDLLRLVECCRTPFQKSEKV